MVTAATIPAIQPGIGTKLHHTMWQNCSRVSMPMPAGTNKRINILGKVFLG